MLSSVKPGFSVLVSLALCVHEPFGVNGSWVSQMERGFNASRTQCMTKDRLKEAAHCFDLKGLATLVPFEIADYKRIYVNVQK